MSLPILKVSSAPTTETLVRYFHQTESKWTEHVAESVLLDFGTAWCNPQFSRVHYANRMLDVALPPGISSAQAYEQATAHFAERGAPCWQWIMNPSANPEQTRPMVEFLVSKGYTQDIHQIMYLDRLPSSLIEGTRIPLRIIPARASFRHAEMINREGSARWNEPQLAEAAMLHLDDPHYDSLLALADGQPAALIGVLAVGEIGRIEEVYVSEAFRRKRIGTTMLSRALEICARSLFKHVMLGVTPDNSIALNLYVRFGFRAIGQCVAYQRPMP